MNSSFALLGLLRRLTPWLVALAVPVALTQDRVQVPTFQLQVRGVSTGFELDGVIQPVKQSTVSAQASGRIVALNVKAGEPVRAGQLLATIDDRETQVGVQRSQAQVTQSDAELRNAQVNAERTRDLQARGFMSKAALDTAETQLKGAQAGREQAVAAARQSALSQGFTRVTAPYDGWVLQTQAQVGDLAVPGKPILTIYAPQPLRAVVQLPASKAEVARLATQVEVLVPGETGQMLWVIPLSRSALPSADPVSQTVEWRLDLSPKTVQHLLPGQQVRVRFVGGQAQRMVVPAAAVLRRGELTAVYVAGEKGFSLRAVRLGGDHGAEGVEIVAGLRAGERVALDPVKAGLAGAQAAGSGSADKQ